MQTTSPLFWAGLNDLNGFGEGGNVRYLKQTFFAVVVLSLIVSMLVLTLLAIAEVDPLVRRNASSLAAFQPAPKNLRLIPVPPGPEAAISGGHAFPPPGLPGREK